MNYFLGLSLASGLIEIKFHGQTGTCSSTSILVAPQKKERKKELGRITDSLESHTVILI